MRGGGGRDKERERERDKRKREESEKEGERDKSQNDKGRESWRRMVLERKRQREIIRIIIMLMKLAYQTLFSAFCRY